MNFPDIVKRIKKAVEITLRTPNTPEAKLRELVAPIWDEYLKEKRIDLHFQARDERSPV